MFKKRVSDKKFRKKKRNYIFIFLLKRVIDKFTLEKLE
jgi:hypothetical protein